MPTTGAKMREPAHIHKPRSNVSLRFVANGQSVLLAPAPVTSGAGPGFLLNGSHRSAPRSLHSTHRPE